MHAYGFLGAWRWSLPLLLSTLLSPAAWAALGQVPAATAQPLTSLALSNTVVAKKQSVPSDGRTALYQGFETRHDTGTAVREFADAQGVVFAVTWQGPVLPPMNTLLADYHPAFQAQAEAIRKSGRRSASLRIQSDALVLQSRGRMRQFVGFAYVPARVPAGVQIDTLLP